MPTKFERIIAKYEGLISGPQDLTGGNPPSKLFYILADKLRYLLDNDPEIAITEKGVKWRRRAHFIIKTLGPHFLSNPQMFENRNFLQNPIAKEIPPDPGINLPDEPVIWISNHHFVDDCLATILAARHAFILFGSMPQFYNTLDGVTAWLNGVFMINRKLASSRHTSTEKAVRVLNFGADLMIFPEGVWNKSPNALLIDLWPGVYRIAKETGAKVVPVVHYLCDPHQRGKDNPIHTVIDNPIRIDHLDEREALQTIRDTMATWLYLMMEVYGQSNRIVELNGTTTSVEAWERYLRVHIKTADRYDTEIELCADYRPKWKPDPCEVWRPIVEIQNLTAQNIQSVLYARRLLEEIERNDFQRRF